MNIYIRSTGNISPQQSLDTNVFFRSRIMVENDYLKCVEPDYDAFIDTRMIRRMSRIVKMGVAAALTCLRNAGIEKPASILTATAYGCLEDTSSFLRRMIEFEETMLSPTAFIQSTHNTVGAQIALMLKCHAYNNTIVHRAFSFENALMESRLLIEENQGPVLVGAIDEITDDRHAILRRFGLYKKTASPPDIAGEGAAFFLLDKEPGSQPLAILSDLQTLYKPADEAFVKNSIDDFLKKNGVETDQIGLVLTGQCEKNDPDNFIKTVFPGRPYFSYRSLCGDYPTSSGFALWLAAIFMKEQKQPEWMPGLSFPLKHIFIHQQSTEDHHSFFIIRQIE
jgi:3-oxoacyl-[acyl-carrier-protein] synthase II